MAEKLMKVEVEVPKELRETLQKVCMAQGEQPSTVMIKALDRYFGEPLPKEEHVFSNGRKWAIPKNTFIVFALPHEEWRKLRKWRRKKNRDRLFFDTLSDNEVLIINETKLENWKARKNKA